MKNVVLDWLSTYPKDLANNMVNEILDNPQRSTQDEIFECHGRFGLDKTNPIPIFGIPNNKIYMDRLRLSDGGSMVWQRMGSINVKDIEYPVDIYYVFNPTGGIIATLYLSPYHLKTSDKAPEGFILL